MNILFAPDFRPDNPYQDLLAQALLAEKTTEISFLSEYKRGLPLYRGVRNYHPNILHLHWPQRYFKRYRSTTDALRSLRFGIDLKLARRSCSFGYVLTAHNLLPHYGANGFGVRRNMAQAYQLADAVICHSASAADLVSSVYRIPVHKLHIVPHGDFYPTLPAPTAKCVARDRLGIKKNEKTILMFGAQAPYKGIEEVVTWWKNNQPNGFTLCLAGAPHCAAYGRKLHHLIGNTASIRWENRYLEDKELAHWLSACDATLFNYRAILTSGAACLARSRGCTILIPRRLNTIELGEPSNSVIRFNTLGDEDFHIGLNSLVTREVITDEATTYRDECSWNRVAKMTREVYDSLAR